MSIHPGVATHPERPHWHRYPWLVIDTETTGVNPYSDRIVQAAALVYDPTGGDLDLGDTGWSGHVNPGIEIPDGATEIHGITTEFAQANGVPTVQAIEAISDLIGEHPRSPVVIYNAAFDWPLILCEAARHGIEMNTPAAILDPLVIDRAIDRYRRGGRKLAAVAEHYGVTLTEAHSATSDAQAAAGVMRALLGHPEFPTAHTLTQMTLWQTREAEAERLRFTDYMRRERDPGFSKPAGWPIPAPETA